MTQTMLSKLHAFILSCIIALLVPGCATQANKDPLEGINRGIYKFNDVADNAVIKPIAKAYKAVAPSPIRIGINNFFNNLGSLTTVLNDLLQLKFANAFTDTGRFVINSTFGIAGLVDVAGMDKIPLHKEDFGQTLGYWGVGNGAYLVLPFLGPSSVRDTTGLVFDGLTTDPIGYLHDDKHIYGRVSLSNQIRLVQFLDKRTELLDAKDIVDEASLDPYAFTRDAYLQRRDSLIRGDAAKPANDGFEPADEDKATPTP
jgi:phospholipid-binding lipoprotein MlaA